MFKKWMMVNFILSIVPVFGCGNEGDPVSESPAPAFTGSFTLTEIADPLNGSPDTDAFNHLLNLPIQFNLSFESIASSTKREELDFSTLTMLRSLSITTGPSVFTFQGDRTGYLQNTVSTNFLSLPLSFKLVADSGSGVEVSNNWVGVHGSQYYGFAMRFVYNGARDALGYPILEDFETVTGTVILRRYSDTGGFHMTDFASGILNIRLSGTDQL